MPVNKYALLRYRIIDKCIGNAYKPYPTKSDLRSACEEALYGSGGESISESTIEKDLWAMRNESELGYYAPIKYDKRHGGYCYEDPDYTIDNIPLNQDDISALQFAAATLEQFRDTSIFEQFGYAIDKLSDRLSLQHQKEQWQFVQFETVPYVKGNQWLEILLKAISERTELQIVYEGYKGKGERIYRFHPHLLKEYRNRWYVTGFEVEGARMLTLGLDRVSNIEVTDRAFQFVQGFDPETFFKHSIGITRLDEEPEYVELHFTPFIGNYVKSQPLHATQRILEDGPDGLLVSLEVQVTPELVAMVLGFGSDVKVMSEGKLRGALLKELQSLERRYAAQ